MDKTVRIGRISDQTRWRREDMIRLSPDQRVAALLQFRMACYPQEMKTLQRVAAVKRRRPAADA